MKRTFLINFLILVLLNILVKPFYIFGIEVQVQNLLGPDIYGQFFSLYSFVLMFHFIMEFGLTNLIKREIAADPGKMHSHLTGYLKIKLRLTAFFILMVIAVWLFSGYGSDTLWILMCNIAIHILMSFLLFFRAFLIGTGRYKTDSFFSIVDKLLMIIFLGVFIYTPLRSSFSLQWFIGLYILTLSLSLTGAIWFSRHGLKSMNSVAHKPVKIDLWQTSLPYAVIALMTGLFYRIDVVLLERILPNGSLQAGIFAGGFRMLDAYIMFALLFANLLLPMMSSLKDDKGYALVLFRFVLGLLLAVTLPFAFGGFFFRNEIIDLLYSHADDGWYMLAGLLFLSALPAGAGILYGSSVLSTGQFRKYIYFLCTIVPVNIALNLYLIPLFQATGAALSILIVQTIHCIALWIIYFRNLGDSPSLNLTIRILLCLVSVCGVMYLSANYLPEWDWRLRLISAGIISLGFAFLTGLVKTYSELWSALLSKKL